MELLYIWCFLLLSCVVIGQDPVVNLPQGRVVGIKLFTENSLKPIEVFYGIPYAAPPIGRLRFSRVDGNLLPVIIILYSDSWLKNGVNLPCQELAAEGFVVVTVSYRLHILAFFSLKSIAARGNLSLLDQYMALIWVRENIATFGGDPNSITLAGHSAGADSVLLHMVSPRSIGLFHRAIIMSPQYIWKAIEKDNVQENNNLEVISRSVAGSLGCLSERESEILHCLKMKSLASLLSQYTNNWTDIIHPIPDNFLPESEQFLPTSLSSALAWSKSPSIPIDVLLGTTDLESINYDYSYEDVVKHGVDYLYNQTISTIIPNLLRLLSLDRPDTLSILSQIIQWEFLGPKMRRENEKQILNILEAIARIETSSKWESGCALLAARLVRRISHLFVYHFSHTVDVDLYGRHFNFTGAPHGSELIALFGDALMLQIARRPMSQIEKEVSSKFKKYIKNFVAFGSPGSQKEWPRYVVGDSYIHEICDSELMDYNQFEFNKRIFFWLQYLPRLSNKLALNVQAEKISVDNDGNRLRGGVIALCGLSTIFITLLGVSVILLYKWRTRRPLDIDSHVAKL